MVKHIWNVERRVVSPTQTRIVDKDKKELSGVFYHLEREMTEEEKVKYNYSTQKSYGMQHTITIVVSEKEFKEMEQNGEIDSCEGVNRQSELRDLQEKLKDSEKAIKSLKDIILLRENQLRDMMYNTTAPIIEELVR